MKEIAVGFARHITCYTTYLFYDLLPVNVGLMEIVQAYVYGEKVRLQAQQANHGSSDNLPIPPFLLIPLPPPNLIKLFSLLKINIPFFYLSWTFSFLLY